MKSLFCSTQFLCFLLILIIAAVLKGTAYNNNNNNNKDSQLLQYPSTKSMELSVPILSIFNEYLKFIRIYLNQSTITFDSFNSIDFHSFGEDQHIQKTVYLRSYYSNEPIQAIHTESVHVFYLNITSLHITLQNDKGKTFEIMTDLAQTAENRWAPISLISSSHLANLLDMHASDMFVFSHNHEQNIRIMTMNIFNYNHWQKRLELIDQTLHKYKPDIIGVQELRIRCKYLMPDLLPNNDPELLHTFQIYDIIASLSYFQTNAGQYQWYSSPAMFFKESTPEQHPHHIVGEGLGIISKFPILKQHKLLLSRDNDDPQDFHQRLLIGATVQIGSHEMNGGSGVHHKLLDVYTTHLSLSDKARIRTLHEIGQFVNNERNVERTDFHHKIGSVLMGDFNVEFDYTNEDILSSDKYNLIDVWKEMGKCEETKTDGAMDNGDLTMKMSFNYNSMDFGNNIWNNALDALYESPNAAYFEMMIDVGNGREYDFNAFAKHLNKIEDQEWWRDGRCQNGWTFNSWDMKKRIDYFFVNQKLFYENVIDTQVIPNDINQTIPGLDAVGGVHDMNDVLFASDHQFMYLDLKVQY